MNFKDKVYIITGSSQGVGKELAKQLCEKGAKVVLNGRNESKLQKVKKEFDLNNHSTLAIPADISSVEDCKELISKTIEEFGRLDGLINNGSITMNEQIEKMDGELFQKIFASNSLGAVLPTLEALPYLKKTKGSVIFLSSLAGVHGLPSASAYSMGKMFLTAFWQSLRAELVKTGIHFGICYLSFTENEKSKRMVTANGDLIPVPERPKFMVQSREKVAKEIMSMISRRKSKKVMSVIGKVTVFTMQHFPRMVNFIIRNVQKNKG